MPDSHQIRPEIQRWKPPTKDHLKLNVDGALNKAGARIGIIIRNGGKLEAVVVDKLQSCFDAEHVETLAILRAVQLAEEFGVTHFVLEGDAANVFNKISIKEEDLSTTGHLIAGIKALLSCFPSVIVSHVGRKNNEPANLAAKLALDIGHSNTWFMDFPKSIVTVVNDDLR